MRYQALLLDLGGVLIDFGGGAGLPVGRHDWRGREALAHYLGTHGRRTSIEDLDQLLFAPWRSEYARRYETGREAEWAPHLKRLRQHAGVRSHAEQLLGLWFRPFGEQIAALPGVETALAVLARREFRLALISNVPLPGALYREVLARLGLDRYLESLHFSYDEGSRKPSPAMLRRALHALETPARFALMVGDRPDVDVAAGRAAGTATAWVRSAHRDGPRADLEVDSLAELPALLR